MPTFSAAYPLRVQRSTFFCRLARLCGLLAGLIGVLTLCEYIFGWNLGIDHWLISEPTGTVGTSHPGRMAPETALCFVLLSAALWIIGSSRKTRWTILASVNLGLLVTALALAAMLSYATPVMGAYGWFGLTIMAMHTAILFAMLGVAVMAINWQQQDVLQWSLSRHTTAAFACGMALLVFIGLNTSRSQFWMNETNRQIAHAEKMLVDAENILAEVIDAQVHSRDYLITGDEKYLKLYLSDEADSQAKLGALYRTEFASVNPVHQQHFTRTEAHIKAQFQWLQQIIDARRTGMNEAARNNMFSHGEDLLDNFRITLDQNKSEDQQIIEQLKRESKSVARFSYISIFFGTFASIMIFLIVIFRLNSAVNERKQADELLRKSASEIEDLYNNAPCGYHSLDKDGVIRRINNTELAWLGYTRDEVVGKIKYADLLTPASILAFREKFPQVKKQGFIHDFEYEIIRKDGTEFSGLANVTAIYDASGDYLSSRSTVFDITERKRAEESQKNMAMKFSTLFESSSDAIFLFDGKGFIDCNPAGLQMFGCLTRDEFIGKNVAELSPPTQPGGEDSMSLAGEHIATAFKNGSILFEWVHRRFDGADFPAEVLLTAMELDGKTVLQATVRDITERKLAEAKLAEQVEELRRWHDVTMGRETRTLELKHEVNELLVQAGQPPRYPSAEADEKEYPDV